MALGEAIDADRGGIDRRVLPTAYSLSQNILAYYYRLEVTRVSGVSKSQLFALFKSHRLGLILNLSLIRTSSAHIQQLRTISGLYGNHLQVRP